MKLATLRIGGSTSAIRIDDGAGSAVEIPGFADVGALLADAGWAGIAARAGGTAHPLQHIDPASWAPVVPRPSKIVCVGLNYRNHILEMGRELPEFPTLFAKYPEALIGPYDAISLPLGAADAVDWEGELAVVIGAPTRRVSEEQAASSIAGYAVINDVTMRDFQYRTPEWFQGKTFENTSPFGPYLVTADEYDVGGELRTEVDGEVVQQSLTSDLVFGPAALISYISNIFTLNPGDVIATGTPGGVGHARTPRRYLAPGETLTTVIEGLGRLSNPIVGE
jgi:acylpyruvate hydrolase